MDIVIQALGLLVATVVGAFFLCWVIQLFPHKNTFPSISPGMDGIPRRTPCRWESKLTQAAPLFVGPFFLLIVAMLVAAPAWEGLLAVIGAIDRVFIH